MQSPLDIEKKLLSFEERTIERLVRQPRYMPFIFIFFVYLFATNIVIPMASVHVPLNLKMHLFTERNDVYLICGVAAGLAYYLPNPIRLFMIAILPVITWLGMFLLRGVKFSPSLLAFPLLAYFFYFLSYWKSKELYFRITKVIITLFLFVLSVYWMLAESMGPLGVTVVSKFWLSHPEFYFLFVVVYFFSLKETRSPWLLLSPLNLVWGTLWPNETEFNTKIEINKYQKLWWQGFYGLATALLIFLLAFSLRWLLKNTKLEFVGTVSFYYLFFILMIVASFNIHIGLARMLGVQCPDATYFLVFAKTPMEVWQRGSTYVYKFFLNFIYIPLQRKIKSYTLVMILCLLVIVLHMFIFHDVVLRLFFMWLLPNLPAPSVQVFNVFVFSLSWAIVWFFWILIGATIWRKLLVKYSSPQVQWLSIALNHIVMASILPLVEVVLVPQILNLFNH